MPQETLSETARSGVKAARSSGADALDAVADGASDLAADASDALK